MLRIVNMVPASMSGESGQDSEPNLAVNPENPNDMVATAFTPAPMGGANAPIYVSTNGGNTWGLRTVVPGNGFVGTGDITVAFATTGGMLYAGTLNGSTGHMQILRTNSFASTATMQVLLDRASEDQPWVVAGSVVVTGTSHDRVFVGNNNFGQPNGQTATIDVTQDGRVAAPVFAATRLERGATTGQDGPPVRTAVHSDGTVYSVFQRWVSGSLPNISTDIVITRDDHWGSGATPFTALTDSVTHAMGQRIATGQIIAFNAIMGQERLGADLTIAVDPTNSATVYVGWCNRVGGAGGTDWTLHVSRSTDRGQTWSADVRTITNAKNPALAINSVGRVGLLYQQFAQAGGITNWETKLELTGDHWQTAVAPLVLHRAPSTTPARTFLPYLGDYVRLLCVGRNYYGVFCGSNTPDMAHFPNGVTYQRAADWTTHTLHGSDGITVVPPSIDPFFFEYSELVVPILPGPIVPGPILRGPVLRGPIFPGPIIREPIRPGPVGPPQPIERGPVRGTPSRKAVKDIDL